MICRKFTGLSALALSWGLACGNAALADAAFFTEEQAERGETFFSQNCTACHGLELADNLSHYPNAAAFFGFVSSEMPMDAPGGLPPQTYADITAFLLSELGFAAGEEELAPDFAKLAAILPGSAEAD